MATDGAVGRTAAGGGGDTSINGAPPHSHVYYIYYVYKKKKRERKKLDTRQTVLTNVVRTHTLTHNMRDIIAHIIIITYIDRSTRRHHNNV